MIAIDPPALPGATAVNLVASGDALLATWMEPKVVEPPGPDRFFRLRFARFANGSWGPASTIVGNGALLVSWSDVPSIARQDDGVLVASWLELTGPEGFTYDVMLARSIDGGATWRHLGVPHRDRTSAEHGFVSLLPDGDAVLALWLDGRASANGGKGPTALRAARVAAAIGPETVVDDRVCDCCSTSAVRAADGPAVVYRDRDADELRDPAIARRAGRAWSAPRPVHADGWKIAGCPVNGPMIAASGREVAVAWYTFAGGGPGVRVAFSADAGATFEPAIVIDGSRGASFDPETWTAAPPGARAPIGRVDVVIDRPGEAIVSWMASVGDENRLLVRRVARDRRRGPELQLAAVPAERNGHVPRLELLGPDLAVAWVDRRAKQLHVARFPRADVPAAISVVDAPAAGGAAPRP
jgi:hypothetical protein